jgi:carotenoid cleavage dioxygenase-like enzyme
VFDRATERSVVTAETDPLFMFHTINARDAGRELVLDLCCRRSTCTRATSDATAGATA